MLAIEAVFPEAGYRAGTDDPRQPVFKTKLSK
jgi:hypothetical protein